MISPLRIGKIRSVVTTLKTTCICHFEEAILNLQHVLILTPQLFLPLPRDRSWRSHKVWVPTAPGAPPGSSLHSHQVSLPDTSHLSLHRLFLGVKQSLLKANGILLCLCFITQTQCCFTPTVVAYLSSLPVGEHQAPHIWVLADDSLILSMLRESSRNVSLHTGVGNMCLPGFQLRIWDRHGNQKRPHQFLEAQLKERQPEGKGSHLLIFTVYMRLFSSSFFSLSHPGGQWRGYTRLYLPILRNTP